MKASKALKRLAKIEALMSDVREKYVTLSPTIRKALRNALIAVTGAKKAVKMDAESGGPKTAPKKKPGSASKVVRKQSMAK
jgi:hypothetical protein